MPEVLIKVAKVAAVAAITYIAEELLSDDD
jgi:hypothetical protein